MTNSQLRKEATKLIDYLLYCSNTGDGVDVGLFNGASLIRHLVHAIDKQEETIKSLKNGRKSEPLLHMTNILQGLK